MTDLTREELEETAIRSRALLEAHSVCTCDACAHAIEALSLSAPTPQPERNEIERELLLRAKHSIHPEAPQRKEILEWLEMVANERGINLQEPSPSDDVTAEDCAKGFWAFQDGKKITAEEFYASPSDDVDGVIERLGRSITTAANDDLSDPMTDKRLRHTERLMAMREAATLLARMRDERDAWRLGCLSKTHRVAEAEEALGRIATWRCEMTDNKFQSDEVFKLTKGEQKVVIKISADGKIELGEGVSPDEASREFLKITSDMLKIANDDGYMRALEDAAAAIHSLTALGGKA